MNDSRPTPATDASSFLAIRANEDKDDAPEMEVVDSEFARRLERQRDTLLEALSGMMDAATYVNYKTLREAEMVRAACMKARDAITDVKGTQ